MMKKLLIVNNNLHIGGVQNALISLLWAIRRQYDVTLLLFHPGGAYLAQIPPEVKLITAGGSYRYIGMSRGDAKGVRQRLCRLFYGGISRIFGRKYALRLMAHGQSPLIGYDVAISYLHDGADWLFYGGCNDFVLRHVVAERKIAFLHCDFSACGGNTPENRRRYRRFDAVAACSAGCANAFLGCCPMPKEKVFVVPNFHRFEEIRRAGQAGSTLFQENILHIVTVARLSPEKGIDRALAAISHLKTDTAFCYHIVGGGILEPQLRRQAAKLGLAEKVQFHSQQENPYPYIRQADLLLIPSYQEAAPMVIDEAAALGTPILSTATISAGDMIAGRGFGWVCPNTTAGLEQALSLLLEQPLQLQRFSEKLRSFTPDNTSALKGFIQCVEGQISQNGALP